MDNPFINSNTNKRYYTFDYYLKSKYKSKVFKVAIDGGFTCPNRDGKVGRGGCYFCSNLGSGENGGNRIDSLEEQYNKVRAMMHQKWPVAKYIVYFQSFSNTYAKVSVLKERFEPFVNKENVVGLAIATRPDCFNEEIYTYLSELNKRTDLTIELGLQTIHDEVADFFNRGYKFEIFLTTFNELKRRNIKVLIHLINGLPHENYEMMLENVRLIGKLKPWGVKIHSLYIIKNTVFSTLYEKDPFPIMSKEEYIELVARQLEMLPPSCVIERLSGDGKIEDLIAPTWTIKKVSLLNDIDKYLLAHNTW
jgi:radical SAM protein (TIGR01212 family)